MKLQFDANQTFQLDAVAAVTDLFDGQGHRQVSDGITEISRGDAENAEKKMAREIDEIVNNYVPSPSASPRLRVNESAP